MKVAFLRFDAPLMSFGRVVVDQANGTDLYPYRGMLAGLVANALGLTRADVGKHEGLQRSLRYSARRDRTGTTLVDYQTVDLSSDGAMASDLGWTAEGKLEERAGGVASEGTHIRYRHYIADSIVTVAFTMTADDGPHIEEVSAALRKPARPLFLGRKCCIPSTPVFLQLGSAPSLREALDGLPRVDGRSDNGPLPAIWPRSEEEDPTRPLWPRVEDRDWANAIHVGRRIYVEGHVNPPSLSDSSKQAAL